MPDEEAIRRLKQGDIGGLETLIACYQVKAIRAAYFIVQDAQAAEDIVQDTFLHVYHHIDSFDENRPFGPYLMRSVVNGALNATRHSHSVLSLDGKESVEHLNALLSEAASLENHVEYSELKHAIMQAIAQLPPRERAAIVQRYYLNMSENEMAERLRAAPGTVKWLLHSARARLRALLGTVRSEK